MVSDNENITTPEQGAYYKVRLGSGAVMRGDRVVCQLLRWAGADENLAHVRVIYSTVPSYRVGKVGLLPRECLAPVRARRAA